MLLEPKMERPAVLRGGREVYVISAKTRNLPKVEAYFEKESGMLARLVYFNDTVFGVYPTQIDYRDYRDVGGIKMPFHMIFAWMDGRDAIQLSEIRTNVAIDAAVFNPRPKPAVGRK